SRKRSTWIDTISRVQFAGQTAIVTGAGSGEGIGFAIATRLFVQGAHVAISSTTARIEDRARELDPSGQRVTSYVPDLTEELAAQNLAASVLQRTGRIDILINNAGMAQTGRSPEFRPLQNSVFADWQRQIEITLYTAYLMMRAVLPTMTERRYGRIVN